MPREIAPFRVTRPEAIKRLHDHLKDKPYLATGFNAAIETVQGVHMPCLLCDIEMTGETSVAATHLLRVLVMRNIEHVPSYYALRMRGNATYKGVTLGMASHLSEAHMLAIDTIRPSDLRPLTPERAAEMPLALPDIPAPAVGQRAIRLARESFLIDARHRMGEYLAQEAPRRAPKEYDGWWDDRVSSPDDDYISEDAVYLDSHTIQLKSTQDRGCLVRVVGAREAYLPFWILHCSWRGEKYLFTVNGLTGACVGNLPMDEDARQHGKLVTVMRPKLPTICAAIASCAIFLLLILALPDCPPAYAWAVVTPCELALIILVNSILDPHTNARTKDLISRKETRLRDEHARHELELRNADEPSSLPIPPEERGTRFTSEVERLEGAASLSKAYDLARGSNRTPGSREVASAHATSMIERAYWICDDFYATARPNDRDDCPCILRTFGPLEGSIIPLDEVCVSVSRSAVDHINKRGFFLCESGIVCRYVDILHGARTDFTRWEELAWARQPTQRCLTRTSPTECVCIAGKVAGLVLESRLTSSQLLALYDRLRNDAREVFPWKRVVNTSPDVAAMCVMAEIADSACQSHPLSTGEKEERAARELLRLPQLDRMDVLMAHVTTGEQDPTAFALTECGFACNDLRGDKGSDFVDWETLSALPEPTRDGPRIRAGHRAIAYYEETEEMAEALLDLCRKLHARSRESYRSDARAFLLAHRPSSRLPNSSVLAPVE